MSRDLDILSEWEIQLNYIWCNLLFSFGFLAILEYNVKG